MENFANKDSSNHFVAMLDQLSYFNVRENGGRCMKNLKNRTFLYAVISIAVLLCNVLPIILRNDAGMTRYSIIPLAFALFSVLYAVIALAFKDKGNLFVAGRFWFYIALSLTFSEKSRARDEEYKREFVLSAFLYCVTIPSYIMFAFFATDFYSALWQALRWTVVRLIAIIVVVILPPIIKNIKARKQQQMADDADRKNQEHRESMGKWK